MPGRYQPGGDNDEPAQRVALHSGANMGLLEVGNLGRPWLPGRFLPRCQLSTWTRPRRTWVRWRTWLWRRGNHHLLVEQRKAKLLRGRYQPRGQAHEPT